MDPSTYLCIVICIAALLVNILIAEYFRKQAYRYHKLFNESNWECAELKDKLWEAEGQIERFRDDPLRFVRTKEDDP